MFGFNKKTDKPVTSAETKDNPTGLFTRLKQSLSKENPTVVTETPTTATDKPKSEWFARLKQGLDRTRKNLTVGLEKLFQGNRVIDDALLEQIETLLLTADLGASATELLMTDLSDQVELQRLTDPAILFQMLRDNLLMILRPVEKPLILPENFGKPFVILMVGINGSGKTTTIGKLAKRFQSQGRSVMLAAGDTFRAAAVEQLKVWGERNEVPVIAQQGRADSASVIFDALQAATARKMDVLIADTAGRLHTQDNLMEELKKVHRIINKLDSTAPHETMLVLDAGTGQNALLQAKQFHQSVAVTGLTITKLDGTAKGGMVFAVAKQMGLPIRFIGVGEQLDDLRSFEAVPFVEALLSRD